jgi:hypothetical protein
MEVKVQSLKTPRTSSPGASSVDFAEATANELTALLAENAARQSVLTAALIRRQKMGHEIPQDDDHRCARWITVEEAAQRSTLSARWFYRRADLPGYGWIRRLENRSIRIDGNALNAFMNGKGKRR